MPTLGVQKREKTGGSAALRRAGFIPAVVYGASQASTPITVKAREFEKVFKEAGEASIVTLEGLGAEGIPTLIHEIDVDPVSSVPRHIDFYAVTKGQKVEVAIPLEFVGESEAVLKGANLVKVMHELSVEADPMKLPHNIEVDLSALKEVGDQIHASDLTLPSGVELAVPGEEVVALIQEVVEEPVEEAPPADLSSIEVEKKGKEEEGEAAPPPGKETAPAPEGKE